MPTILQSIGRLCLLLLGLGTGLACVEPLADKRGASFTAASWDIVPLPVLLEKSDGPGFFLGEYTRIDWAADDAGIAEQEARRLQLFLQDSRGWDLRRPEPEAGESSLLFALDPALEARLGKEGYRIQIRQKRLSLHAAGAKGLFYAGQTLRQMMSPGVASADASRTLGRLASDHVAFQGNRFAPGVVEDYPRFGWRGMHLDVGRHMYSVEEIKRFLDGMAFYKFNVFHWHLTEDQGWRIEIKAFPRLTEVGGFRKASPVRGKRNESDGVPYGGFYTQEEIRSIVAYAAELKIDVMPEIELPGHSLAAITAYPELGNPEFVEGLEVGTRWGVYPNILNPSARTLRFYEQVFDEVLALFPFAFIHIGGDEAPKEQWKNSPSAQARMRELGLADEHQLQAWFVAHFESYLAARGRRLVGWDEIQEGGLPKGASMMVWRGWNYGVEAARKGHDIIMAPTSHTYFDYYQGDPSGEPEAIGGRLDLERVYAFEPIPKELNAEEARHVLGGQGQLWSEYLPDWKQVEYMAYPRMLALAEVLWSTAEQRDWADFQRRLPHQMRHMNSRGIGYRIPVPVPDVDVVLFEERTEFRQPKLVRANREAGDSWLVHTQDGSPPRVDSPRLPDALVLHESKTIRVARQQQGTRVGHGASIRFVRLDGAVARALPDSLEAGLQRQDFLGVEAARIPDFEALLAASKTGEQSPWKVLPARAVPGVALDDLHGKDRFAARFRGWIQVDEAGVYTFALGSDDGSQLAIAGVPLIDLDGLHGHITKEGRIRLPAGTWSFELGYFEAGGAESLALRVEGPGAWRFLREPLP